jgi:hypothetical protein
MSNGQSPLTHDQPTIPEGSMHMAGTGWRLVVRQARPAEVPPGRLKAALGRTESVAVGEKGPDSVVSIDYDTEAEARQRTPRPKEALPRRHQDPGPGAKAGRSGVPAQHRPQAGERGELIELAFDLHEDASEGAASLYATALFSCSKPNKFNRR